MVGTQEALERFEALPWPARTDEEWRRTDPALLEMDRLNLQPEALGFRVGWETPSPELIRSGVVLTHLSTALQQLPEQAERYLFRSGAPSGLAKFVALHQARAREGLFCYVPDRVKVEMPVRSWIESTAQGTAFFPHVLVALGEEAELTLVDERRPAPGESAAALADEQVEIFLGSGSSLQYVHLQRWGPQTAELMVQRAVLERDAQLLNITVGLGGRLTKGSVEASLAGPGARSELLGVFFGSGRQHFDLHTLQEHRAQSTASDLLYKSALADEARAIYTGLIRITRQGQKSDAYQANRNLLLSQGAKADSVPMLEIEADDVRCTHGVAVGPIEEEQAFYLMSRGLSQREAERLIVHGFFEQVFRRIPLERLREELAEEVDRRLESSRG